MVANVNGPQFSGGANIALKSPSHTYEQMVDEIEQLQEDFDGFFISAPAGVIHLVIGQEG